MTEIKLDGLTFLRASPPLEVKLDGADARGVISGLASPFGPPADTYGDIIERGAFAKAIASGELPAMLWNHDPSAPIGRWEEVREGLSGLFVRGRLNLESARGREAFAHVKNGDATGLSIGYTVPQGGARAGEQGTKILTEVHLLEVSVVTLPAAGRARVTEVKTLGTRSDLEALLREAGLAKTAARRVVDGGWPALAGITETDPEIERLAKRIDAATAQLRTKG